MRPPAKRPDRFTLLYEKGEKLHVSADGKFAIVCVLGLLVLIAILTLHH